MNQSGSARLRLPKGPFGGGFQSNTAQGNQRDGRYNGREMNLPEDVQPRSDNRVLLAVKVLTAFLLLVAVGVVALSSHEGTGGRAEAGQSVAVIASDAAASQQVVAATSVTDPAAAALMTLCAFIAACCAFLVAARFTWRRAGRGPFLAVSPRGSPRWSIPAGRLPHQLSLSQLSISRT